MKPPWSAAFLSRTRPALTSVCHPYRSWRSDSRSKSDICSNSRKRRLGQASPRHLQSTSPSSRTTIAPRWGTCRVGAIVSTARRIGRSPLRAQCFPYRYRRPLSHHGVLLFAMVLVLLLLVIESRRYRFFDVYRARVRRLERQYYARIFSPAEEGGDTEWMRELSDHLKKPVFLMSRSLAFSRRLRRNYIWMFLILLVAWLLKISSPKLMTEGEPGRFAQSLSEWTNSAALGPLPGWMVFVAVAAFYCWILYAALRRYAGEGELAIGDVHV